MQIKSQLSQLLIASILTIGCQQSFAGNCLSCFKKPLPESCEPKKESPTTQLPPYQFEKPEEYDSWSRCAKLGFIWEQIQETATDPIPPLPPAPSNFDLLVTMFDLLTQGKDAFDDKADFRDKPLSKPIHTYGVVAPVHLEPSQSPFTGLYQQNAIGLLRLSSVNSPGPDQSGNFEPSLSLKFFVNGEPSVNLVTAPTKNQVRPWNAFQSEQSTKIDLANSSQVVKVIFGLLNKINEPSTEVSPAPLAMVTGEGERVAKPVSPQTLVFKPTLLAKVFGAVNKDEDYRVNLRAQLPIGIPLYSVYGTLNGEEYYIGRLILDAPFQASLFGDEYLIFRHNRYE